MLQSLLPMPMREELSPPPDRLGRSAAAREVAALFGLPEDDDDAPHHEPDAAPQIDVAAPAAGQILLVVGASGAGKSTLLRRLVAGAGQDAAVIDVARVRLRRAACVDQFGGRRPGRVPFALDLLARVGLAEAHTYLRRPAELSDGQRWRLRLAVALARCMTLHARGGTASTPTLLVADEFAAVLDRVSAAVVARSLRRSIDRLSRVGVGVAALLATSHDDLEAALLPDAVARCDFGPVTVTRPSANGAADR